MRRTPTSAPVPTELAASAAPMGDAVASAAAAVSAVAASAVATRIVTLDRARLPLTPAFRATEVDVGVHYFSELEQRRLALATEERAIERPRQIWGLVRPTLTSERDSPGYLVYWDERGLLLDTSQTPRIDTGHGIALSLGGSDTTQPAQAAAGSSAVPEDVATPVYANFFPQAREMNEHGDWRRFEDALRIRAEALSREEPPRIVYYGIEPHYADAPERSMELATPTELRVFTQEVPYHPALVQAMESHPALFTPQVIAARARAGASFMPTEAFTGLDSLSVAETTALAAIPARLTTQSFTNTPSRRDLAETVDDLVLRHTRDIRAAQREAALHSLELVMKKDPAELARLGITDDVRLISHIAAQKIALNIPAEAVYTGARSNRSAAELVKGSRAHLARREATAAIAAASIGGAPASDFYQRFLANLRSAAPADTAALEARFREDLTHRGFVHPMPVLMAGAVPPRLRRSASSEDLSVLSAVAARLKDETASSAAEEAADHSAMSAEVASAAPRAAVAVAAVTVAPTAAVGSERPAAPPPTVAGIRRPRDEATDTTAASASKRGREKGTKVGGEGTGGAASERYSATDFAEADDEGGYGEGGADEEAVDKGYRHVDHG